MAMDFESNYDIAATAHFIRTHNFTRVALQVRPSSSIIYFLSSLDESKSFRPLVVKSLESSTLARPCVGQLQ